MQFLNFVFSRAMDTNSNSLQDLFQRAATVSGVRLEGRQLTTNQLMFVLTTTGSSPIRPVSYSPNTPSAGFEQFTYSVPLGPHGEVDVLDLQVPSVIPAHTEPAAIGQLTRAEQRANGYLLVGGAGLSNGTTGRAVPSDLIVTKGINQASRSLFNSARIGLRLATVVIKVNDPKTGVPYITYTMTNALMTQFKRDDSLASIIEKLSFTYEALRTDITIGGVTTTSCWDFQRNISCS